MNLSLLFIILTVALFAWMFWRARAEIKPAALRDALKAGPSSACVRQERHGLPRFSV